MNENGVLTKSPERKGIVLSAALRRVRILLLAVFLTAISTNLALASPLLQNGSFETGTFVANTQDSESLAPGSTAMTGWTTYNAELAWIGPSNPFGITAPNGSYSLDLTGYHDAVPYAGVTQTVVTAPGSTYALSFEIGIINGTSAIQATAGSATQLFTSTISGPTNLWQTFTMTFAATSNSTAVSLLGVTASNAGTYLGLDNVSLTLVPEPSLTLLVACGTGMLLLPRPRRTC